MIAASVFPSTDIVSFEHKPATVSQPIQTLRVAQCQKTIFDDIETASFFYMWLELKLKDKGISERVGF